MTKEQIEKAALHNAVGRFDDDDEILDAYIIAFEDGVKWGANSPWKDKLEKCQTCRRLLVEFTNNNVALYEDVRELKGIEDLVSRWAYLDDIVPKGLMQ